MAEQRQAAFGEAAERGVRDFHDDDCLDHLANAAAPLRLLKVTEHGTGGMHGPWPTKGASESEQMSKLFLALCSIGDTDKRDSHSGGSYGYGKSGFIRGSKIQAVIAYSCFHPHPTEPQITRRLLGAIYWPKHHRSDDQGNRWTFPGVGRFGKELKPLDNDEADEVARRLQLQVRSPHGNVSRGTTLLIVDPTVSPVHVAKAFERYWWPALVDRDLGFHIEVIDYDGAVVPLQYDDNADIRPFIDAYEVAVTAQNVDRDDMRKSTIRKPRGSSRDEVGGRLVLTSEIPGWSFPDDQSYHRSLVALMRYPRMVVEYRKFQDKGSAPFVRGTFVASDEIDTYLRDTENKTHDTWITQATVGDVDREAIQRAKYVLDSIREHVWDYKSELTPSTPDEPLEDLHFLDQLMRDLGLGGRGRGNPRPPQRPRHLSISPGALLQRVGPERRVTGTAIIAYNTDFPGYEALPTASAIVVTLACKWRGDDKGFGSEYLPLEVKYVSLSDFIVDPNDGCPILKGTLHKGQDLKIDYESDCYTRDWTVQLEITAELEKDGDS